MTSLRCHVRRQPRRWLAFAGACLGLSTAPLGCANYDGSSFTSPDAVAQTADLTGKDQQDDAIAWAACPSDFGADCAWVALPVDHSQPDAGALPIFVSRFPARSGEAVAQMWLLQGGPGGSGNVFRNLISQLLAPLLPDVDFYVLEHRGVGESARLGCAAEESPTSQSGESVTADEWPACTQEVKTQWAGRLDDFTTTQDAEDLASLIARTREPDKQVFVYGVSYGTTRAMRFLQTHPDLVDGVILDSIVSPGVEFLSQFDEQYDPVARDLSDLCAADPVCAQKLGDKPWEHITGLLDKLDRGYCPAFLYRSLVRQGFTQLLMNRELRAHVFALTYRLERCAPEDIAVIEHYFSAVSQTLNEQTAADRASPALQIHVSLSELWEDPAPSQAELKQRCDAQVFCPQASKNIGARYDYWPRYPHDAYTNAWPQTKVPVLAMNGTLDPQTPIEKAQAADAHFNGPFQHFVKVPWSPHGVVFSSPVKTQGAPTCGAQLLRGFVADPLAEPDTSCLDDLAPVFALNPALTQRFFGTPDMWENRGPAGPTVAQSAPAAADDVSRVSIDEHAFEVWPLALNWVPTP